jgi:plastocyanin
MQHGVHNPATIRVVDRTDVSGRVTADEVNLERFHNRIRKVCASVAATSIPSSLRWMLLFAVLIVPQVLRGAEWFATVGAQSSDKGRQALAFLPNEIWINVNDSITWRIDVDEPHTVTFLADTDPPQNRPPFFAAPTPAPSATPPFPFDGSKSVSSTGDLASIAKGDTFTVQFLKTGNFKLVCLFHENMTGVVHVLKEHAQLPHDQAFYDRQAADQRLDLLSDRDNRLLAGCQQHGECAANGSLTARVVTAGIGEISATAGGTQTLSVVRFLDDKIQIRAGDTVEWTNQDPVTPHTVTFEPEPENIFGPVPNPPNVDADGALLAVVKSNAETVSSGILRATLQDQTGSPQTALGVTRFRVTFPDPGVFPYICTLHDGLGMKGMVIVFPKVPPQGKGAERN